MSKLLLLRGYNNYFNRIVKRAESAADYMDAADVYYLSNEVSFNPGDGVDTSHVLNILEDTYDYCVVLSGEEIDSRWFIMDSTRTKIGQYNITLRRDVMADYKEDIVGSPIYIEKATIRNADDIAIYNRENIDLNEIKKSETLLKDDVGVPWIVGYFAKNTASQNINIEATNFDAIQVSTLESWSLYPYISSDYKYVTDLNVEVTFSLRPSVIANGAGTVDLKGNYSVGNNSVVGYAGQFTQVPTGKNNRTAFCSEVASWFRTRRNTIRNYYTTEHEYKFTDDVTSLDGKYIYVSSGTSLYGAGYYKISVSSTASSESGRYAYSSDDEKWFNDLFKDEYDNYYYYYREQQESPSPNVSRSITYNSLRISLTSVSSTALTLSWPADPRHLTDAPYGMFCIPADSCYVTMPSGSVPFYSLSRQEAINAATTIATALDSSCYDLQLVPFCPFNIEQYGFDYKQIDSTKFINAEKAFITDENNHNKGIVLFASVSTFDRDIAVNLKYPVTVNDKKISIQADKYRICSPNYASFFDFNIVKTGPVTEFNIDCTYKPYNPYIHINPVWSADGLYGGDYNDPRGLICQGDFAVPTLSDQWKNYQLNNKNYLNAFNREIDSLEIQNDIAHTNEMAQAVAGTIQGAVSGATTGAMVGGGYGAIAGAVVGGMASGIGGAMDVMTAQKLREENMSLTKDRFNYNIRNIQARPNTLSKLSSFDANNKVFPIIEYYTCTDEEKVMFKDKMKYNGMTIMRIGTIAEFLSDENENYIKGQLIRLEETKSDYHLVSTIADELNKGVYM